MREIDSGWSGNIEECENQVFILTTPIVSPDLIIITVTVIHVNDAVICGITFHLAPIHRKIIGGIRQIDCVPDSIPIQKIRAISSGPRHGSRYCLRIRTGYGFGISTIIIGRRRHSST